MKTQEVHPVTVRQQSVTRFQKSVSYTNLQRAVFLRKMLCLDKTSGTIDHRVTVSKNL